MIKEEKLKCDYPWWMWGVVAVATGLGFAIIFIAPLGWIVTKLTKRPKACIIDYCMRGFGVIVILFGILLSLTLIYSIIGIPCVLLGIYISYYELWLKIVAKLKKTKI